MKKKLLFFLLFATSFNTAIAQSVFNEDDLIGKWSTNQQTKESNPMEINSLKFSGYYYYKDGSQIKAGGIENDIMVVSYYIYRIKGYFISHSNRLHIIFGENHWVFKIVSLTSDRMVLSYTYKYGYSDGSAYYDNHPIKDIEVEFYKEEASAINEITNKTTDSDKIYNLKGQLLENEPDSGVYIQNGKKYVKK